MTKTKKSTKNDNLIAIDQDAYDKLVDELNHRKGVLRKEIAEEIAQARDLGDLSENHGYTVAMEKKDMNEARISELEDMLQNVKIVEKKVNDNFVGIGESVEIENIKTKQKRKVTLVGSEESQSADPIEGKISIDSPIGKAVYNAKIGDIVKVVLAGNKSIDYKILKFIR